MNRNREMMLREIQELDFRVQDLRLYLDTHPQETAAAEAYNTAVKKGKAMTDHYEKLYGAVTPTGGGDATARRWVEGPWPWQSYKAGKEEGAYHVDV
ncbi:MAG: spore coat protein CotJB [Clostridiales bacterium]|jgi:spore coat protein JB|nr:spore coat protein CotJB [Clostridiales bacterium]